MPLHGLPVTGIALPYLYLAEGNALKTEEVFVIQKLSL
jgi:hypothetical protein